LYQALVDPAGVTVTPPVAPPLPPLAALTDKEIGSVCVWPPPVPVIVTELVLVMALAEAVKVRVLLVPVAEAGSKVAVTPLGRPVVASATMSVNPPLRVMVMALVAVAPWVTAAELGLAESEKSAVAAALTVRVTGAVRVTPPPVAVTVTAAVPAAALLEAVRVKVEVLPAVEAGLKLAVTPAGRPVAVSATLLANPPLRVMVMALVADAPWATVREAGRSPRGRSRRSSPHLRTHRR
jgi:antitoxin (DNA-binding transcriptional repressor) of toxin-antitoxin stability system